MSKTAVITARVTPEVAAALDGLAARLGKSRAAIAAEAIRDYAEEQAAFLEFVDEGERDIDEGRFYTEQQMNEWFDERIAAARKKAERAKAA